MDILHHQRGAETWNRLDERDTAEHLISQLLKKTVKEINRYSVYLFAYTCMSAIFQKQICMLVLIFEVVPSSPVEANIS